MNEHSLRMGAAAGVANQLMPLRALQILFFCVIAFSQAAHAAMKTRLRTGSGGGVVINADEMEIDTEKQTRELRGNVQIIYDQQFLSCDHAIVDEAKQEVTAEGNLVVSSAQAYMEGDRAVFSLKDNTGVITNGFVKSGPVIFEGRTVKKTGPQSYDAENASFTACTTCPTAWTFSGSRIQAEIGGYAYIKHARLRVANIPTIWLPYLIVPLKSERQTGFLIPTIDFNADGGYAPAESFFWALSRSQDATFTAKYYTLRTLKGLANYRYMLNPTSGGELTTGLIHDRVFPGELAPLGIDPGSKVNRFFVEYHHNYDLPNGFNHKMKLNYVSDLLYPRDFPTEMLGSGDPALESRMSLTKNTERTHASVDASYYINQLHTNPIQSNSDAVHRIPEIRFDAVERPITQTGLFSGLLFNFHSDYVSFVRDGQAWDDIYPDAKTGLKAVDVNHSQPGAGVFTPTNDVIRTGQRIDLQPEISAPFRIGKSIDVLPSVNFHHTQYSLNVTPPPGSTFDPTPYRQYVRGKLSLRTTFSRVYGDNTPIVEQPRPSVTNWTDDESRIAGDSTPLIAPLKPIRRHDDVYRHEIEPEIVLAGVRDTHNTDQTNAFLGNVTEVPSFLDYQPISDADFQSDRGVQFDYYDRLTNRNTVTGYLTNRLVKKTWLDDGTPTYKQIASLKIGQGYDFDEAKAARDNKFPWSDISTLLDTRLDYFETNTLVRYFPYHGKTNTSSRARVMDAKGRYLEMNFVQNYLITMNTADAYNGRTETLGFLAGFIARYLEFNGGIDLNPRDWSSLSFDVKSWSARLNIKPPGNCWGIILTLRQDLGQKLDYHLAFDYNFGGEPPKVAVE